MASRASEEPPRSQIIEALEEHAERRSFTNHPPVLQAGWVKKSRTSVFNKVMATVNLALGVILATSIGLIAHESTKSCSKSVAQVVEPYSPALKAVVPLIKKFKPEPIFQSGTSEAVEAAWKKMEGVNSGLVVLGPEESIKLSKTSHESVTLKSDPDKHIYGISMYQQLRCLNIIRKSFYRGTFYPSFTDEMFQAQKSGNTSIPIVKLFTDLADDCFDFLRQAIQCHGDVSMTYFGHENHNMSRRDGSESPADGFGNNDVQARAGAASVFWDVEHSCRALEPIEEWVAAHQLGAEHVNEY